MERLTDSEIESIALRFPTHFAEPPMSVLIQRMLTEIKERRAADLSERERDGLALLLTHARTIKFQPHVEHRAATALATLDRLLGQGSGA